MPRSERINLSISVLRTKKQAGVAVLLSGKTDFKIKQIRRHKGYSILIKGTINQGEVTMLNICAPISGRYNFIKMC